MKIISTYLAFFAEDRRLRRNMRSLLKYVVFLSLVITVYAVLFHFIMVTVEGAEHSWVTGLYWTLTVMSTLGFGDITFTSDIGRAFSILVLLSGIVLLLIVLPFAFIRFFYAPWLEARLRLRAPRAVPEGTKGHVVICALDSIAPGLVSHLQSRHIPCYVLEPDPTRAAALHGGELPVVTGEVDSAETYRNLRVDHARLVLANSDEVTNTNITLTVREVSPEVPLVAVAENLASVDILELSGATHVLPLKRRLGEQLAARLNTGRAQTHIIGRFRNLLVAEFPVHRTPLVGRTIRTSNLREIAGVNVIGVWEQARLLPVHPDLQFKDLSVPVVLGTREEIDRLDEFLCIYDANYNPVVVIGGGRVGRAAVRALMVQGVPVTIVERRPAMRSRLEGLSSRLVIGDAARREVMEEAGLHEAPSVLLTTADDAVNLYLCIYCRRLNPALRIVSRITHQRNVESIQRAGADLALSYAHLGVESILSLIHSREVVVLGEGVEMRAVPVPRVFAGQTLAGADLGARYRVNVVAVQGGNGDLISPSPDTRLEPGAEMFVVADPGSMAEFLVKNH